MTSTVTLSYFIDVETGPDFPDEDTRLGEGTPLAQGHLGVSGRNGT